MLHRLRCYEDCEKLLRVRFKSPSLGSSRWAAEAWERLRGRPRGVRSAARGGGSDAARPGCVRQPRGRRRGRCHEDCRASRALDAAGDMEAENAPTAPWKSLRDIHKRPPSLLVMTLRTDKRRRACAQLGLTRYSHPLLLARFSNVRQSANRKSSENHCINTVN